jgi:hypothetical protein
MEQFSMSTHNSLLGRWDLTLSTPREPLPAWLEVRKSGHETLVGQFVGMHGSARPISRVILQDDTFSFSIPPQWERGDQDLTVEGQVTSEGIQGTLWLPGGAEYAWKGVRAPSLRPAAPPQWGEPITLFNGTDLLGWRVIQGENTWSAINGVLTNTGTGGNLVTEQRFGDFRLQLEFRYPPKGNSGVYLRGRYEVQIVDSLPGEPANDLMGAIYGFLEPSALVTNGPDTWNSYDITLLGRMVTVVINGQTVIANQAIPGITGGALDSDEGAPGPILLQGDHGPVEYRNIVLTPAT